MRSLRARITLVTVLVAVVAVAITGLVSLQLVRSSTTEEARQQLAAQADILAAVPRLASAAELADKASLALGGTLVALVRDGSAEGDAARYVDAALLARLAAGEDVSTVRRGDPGVVMIEARPAGDGTAIVLALPLSAVDRAVGQVSARVLLALGIGLGVAVVGGTVIARLLSRPLTAAAASARRLAAGERGVRMPASTTTEVADLTAALAALDTALAASEGRQREFLLSLSHELRTPLTAVRGYGEALADGLVTDVPQVGRTLVAETQRLDRFVSDLLELARLEAEDFTVAVSPIDIAALLEEVAAAWAGRAATLGAAIRVEATGRLETDPRRLRQVIDGLVENALRAGATTIILRSEHTEIAVLDDGPGLDPEDLTVAFDRGVLRGKYQHVRSVGTGLGLSIAVRLVTRMGGTISASNRPEGGAAFAVRLPGTGL
jgi:two-component system sensor histidine kinase BaeS